jgi:hypothetical protein
MAMSRTLHKIEISLGQKLLRRLGYFNGVSERIHWGQAESWSRQIVVIIPESERGKRIKY